MKYKTFYWLCYLIACNVVMFVMCGLPWYAVIALSYWYILLAIPLTCLACLVMGEFLIMLDKEAEKVGDKRITWHDVAMFFLDV